MAFDCYYRYIVVSARDSESCLRFPEFEIELKLKPSDAIQRDGCASFCKIKGKKGVGQC